MDRFIQRFKAVFGASGTLTEVVDSSGNRLPVKAVVSLEENHAGVFEGVDSLLLAKSRSVSAVNTAQAVTLDLRDVRDTLAISSVGSGLTHTLTVEASIDNVNFITIDSLAAALSHAKQYTATTVGATTALSPLAFRYVRITSGAGGAAITTTLTIAAK